MKRLPGFIINFAWGLRPASVLSIWCAVGLWLVCAPNRAASADLDLTSYTLKQTDAAHSFTFPSGTKLAPGDFVIVARKADRSAFQTYWGVTLGTKVHFINSNGKFPQINGGETFQLLDAQGKSLDGPTPPMQEGQNWQRLSPSLAAGVAGSWVVQSASLSVGAAGPGSYSGQAVAAGKLFISEFSDTTGTGTYSDEFIELLYEAGDIPPAAPAAPTGLKATWGEGWVDLKWTASSASSAIGYFVYRRCPPEAAFKQLNSSALAECTYRDSSITLGQAYLYYVRAEADGLASDPSQTVEVTPGRNAAQGPWWLYP